MYRPKFERMRSSRRRDISRVYAFTSPCDFHSRDFLPLLALARRICPIDIIEPIISRQPRRITGDNRSYHLEGVRRYDTFTYARTSANTWAESLGRIARSHVCRGAAKSLPYDPFGVEQSHYRFRPQAVCESKKATKVPAREIRERLAKRRQLHRHSSSDEQSRVRILHSPRHRERLT